MTRAVLRYIGASLILGFLVFAATRIWGTAHPRTVRTDVVQAIFIGLAAAFLILLAIGRYHVTIVNGWSTIYGIGDPKMGLLKRAACSVRFLGPINAAEEAMYWITGRDAAGRSLSGAHDYVLHFPPGQLPPNRAFWSVTMGDAKSGFVPNPINRYSVSDRSGLSANPDGSLDILIQRIAPPGRESNWLPAPSGKFLLWLRIYLPEQPVLDGTYAVPPITRVG